MIKDTTIMALKQIPGISKDLKSGKENAISEMKAVIITLVKNRHKKSEAMAMASSTSLLKAMHGKKISHKMEQTIKATALLELACEFNCEADFLDNNKIKLLKGLTK